MWRGNDIEFIYDYWIYSDTKQKVTENKNRSCGHCGKDQTAEGHDGCISTLSNVMNACCGHGRSSEAYVQLLDSSIISGKENIDRWLEKNK
jgi:hypothetical protein